MERIQKVLHKTSPPPDKKIGGDGGDGGDGVTTKF